MQNNANLKRICETEAAGNCVPNKQTTSNMKQNNYHQDRPFF